MSARPQVMKMAVKLVNILIARFLCVGLRMMISGLIDIATKINPASAAAPPPTMTKKLFHCSAMRCSPQLQPWARSRARRSVWRRRLERIDQLDAAVEEITDVAGGDGEAVQASKRGDLAVRHAERPAELLAPPHHLPIVRSRVLVKGQDAAGKCGRDDPVEALLDRLPTLSPGHDAEAVANLAHGDGGEEERRRGLGVEPSHNGWRGRSSHHLRYDVGVDDDHGADVCGYSSSGGSCGWRAVRLRSRP